MAEIYAMDDAEKQKWDEWVESRESEVVRDLARRFPHNRLFLLKDTGHRVMPYSYSEDGTLTVAVTGRFNAVMFERTVFGITPDALEECDLPGPEEPVGTMIKNRKNVKKYLAKLREREVRE